MRKFFVLLCAVASMGVVGARPLSPAPRRERKEPASRAKVHRRGEASRLRQEQTPIPSRPRRMAIPVPAQQPLAPLPEVPGVTWEAI